MSSSREMRLRIRSVKNISQVTRALETVSASRVRKAMQANAAAEPYAEKAWKVLVHLACQPGANSLHPLLTERKEIKKVLALMVSGDRGLAGPYNVNIVRSALDQFRHFEQPVSYVTVGQKGRDMMLRRRKTVVAEFSHLPSPASFLDVSPIGRLLVGEFLQGQADQVYLIYMKFYNMVHQEVVVRKILPLEVEENPVKTAQTTAVFTYEPDETQLLDEIIPRFTAIQIYQAILSAQASEHAARMIAMRNATDNAMELITGLQLEYNKLRQQIITNDMLDIAGGAEALALAGF
jgi:F-type H+-transporting ATPase subunit gamma